MTAQETDQIITTDPLAGLSATERAELERLAAHHGDPRNPGRGRPGRPVNSDAVAIPAEGMMRILAGTGARRPGCVRPPLAGARQLTEEDLRRADELAAKADREAQEAAAAARTANRHASYLRQRNPRYAERSFATLLPQQRMDGRVERWLDSPGAPSTLVLLGRSRAGKTGAGYAITNEAHRRGLWVEVITAHGVSQGLKEDKTAVWQRVTGCDVLFLDDLGRERVTDWWRDFLQELVNERHGAGAAGKRMLVSANTSIDRDVAYEELLVRYGDPIVERLMDHAGVLMFDGPPIRSMVSDW